MKNNVLLLVIILFMSCCYDCNDYYSKKIHPIEINGKIDTLYIDENNRFAKTLIFQNQKGKGLVESWVLGLYENCEKGDSIHKAKGSLAIYLYKEDTTMVFYPICDGDTLR